MSREYICDYCKRVIYERYPWPQDESQDFCNEDCHDKFEHLTDSTRKEK